MDARLDVYRGNARRIPSVSGKVIPERAFSKLEYEERILQPMYRDIAPHDPDGILQHEWLNARGAIARFDRNAIEIRVLDIQECPAADLAILELIIATIRALTEEKWSNLKQQQAWGEQPLEAILLNVIRDGENAPITDPDYLGMFGANPPVATTAGHLWKHLAAELDIKNDALETILNEGCLSRRILKAVGPAPSRQQIETVYRRLTKCLADGVMFRGLL
jgi:gamma-glutamyl:cysteine ligase YbdK (ATP-grasp superfamily)